MLKPETYLVTPDNGPRPAGPPDECFYCQTKLGGEHKPNCVLRLRTVVVRATIEYVITVPEFWSPDFINFHRNDSPWCSSNMIGELKQFDTYGCLCHVTTWEYLREADDADMVMLTPLKE